MKDSIKLKSFNCSYGDTFQEHISFFLNTQSLLCGYNFQEPFNYK